MVVQARGAGCPLLVTQAVQRLLHRVVLEPIFEGQDPTQSPVLPAIMGRLPGLSVVPAYFVGVGFRPEQAPPYARR